MFPPRNGDLRAEADQYSRYNQPESGDVLKVGVLIVGVKIGEMLMVKRLHKGGREDESGDDYE